MSKVEYEFGDWVIYDPGYKQEIGRVASVNLDKHVAFVCYSTGCTAAATSLDLIRPATQREIMELGDTSIGFHRFDDECDKFLKGVCDRFCPDKAVCCG